MSNNQNHNKKNELEKPVFSNLIKNQSLKKILLKSSSKDSFLQKSQDVTEKPQVGRPGNSANKYSFIKEAPLESQKTLKFLHVDTLKLPRHSEISSSKFSKITSNDLLGSQPNENCKRFPSNITGNKVSLENRKNSIINQTSKVMSKIRTSQQDPVQESDIRNNIDASKYENMINEYGQRELNSTYESSSQKDNNSNNLSKSSSKGSFKIDVSRLSSQIQKNLKSLNNI